METEEEDFEEEISTLELDDILKQTKTKLEHFQEEELGEPEPAVEGAETPEAEVGSETNEGESAEETNKE